MITRNKGILSRHTPSTSQIRIIMLINNRIPRNSSLTPQLAQRPFTGTNQGPTGDLTSPSRPRLNYPLATRIGRRLLLTHISSTTCCLERNRSTPHHIAHLPHDYKFSNREKASSQEVQSTAVPLETSTTAASASVYDESSGTDHELASSDELTSRIGSAGESESRSKSSSPLTARPGAQN